MNLKRFLGVIALVCMIGLFGACSKVDNEASKSSNTETNAATKDTKTTNPESDQKIKVSKDNPPTRKAEYFGKIKTVTGNEVTLLLAEDPKPLTKEAEEKRKAEMQSLTPEEKKKRVESETKYTGEQAAIIIPVGVPIVTGSDSQEVVLTELKPGSYLRIWTEGANKDSKSAEFVRFIR